MHLNNYNNRHDLLLDWVLAETPRGSSILDVGANDSRFCPEVKRIYEHAGLYAGVDPDIDKLMMHPYLARRYPGRLEDANIPPDSFDCLFCLYVFEHLVEAARFLSAAARVLRPGGSLFFITPNGQHYFAFIARALGRLGWQRFVLNRIRPSALVTQYHYPSLYSLNTPSRIRSLAAAVGFGKCEFRYSERLEEFACYFPGPTKVLPWLWERLALLCRKEALLGNLMGKMTKSAS